MDASEFTDFQAVMTRGDVFPHTFTVTNALGAPVDITTDLKLWMTGKLQIPDVDGSAVFQLTDGGGGIVKLTQSGATLGQATGTVPSAATSALPNHDTLIFVDVQRKNAAGQISTVQRGTILVQPEITISTT